MRAVISLHIGQPGIQIAHPCWELFCLEHDVRFDGSSSNNKISNLQVLFTESINKKYTPRAALFDGDQGTIDWIKGGSLKKLFHPNFVHQLKMESGSIWPRAYGVKDEEVEDILKKLLEGCDSISGIMIYHSVAGGYGGGFTCKLLEILDNEASKSNKSTISLMPSDSILDQSVVEPYNSVLTLGELQEYTDNNILLENDALYRICERHVEKPNFTNLNQMIAQAVSSFTSSLRFGGQRCVDFYTMREHLIPLPKLKLLWCSYAPFINIDQQRTSTISLDAITQALFNQRAAFIKFNRQIHKYIGSTLFYRGNCPTLDLKQSIASIKGNQNIDFVGGEKKFQIALSSKEPSVQGNTLGKTNRSVGMIANSTAVLRPLQLLKKRFQTLYSKKSFIHWYNGLEDGQLTNSLEDINQYISLYNEQQGSLYSNDIIEENVMNDQEEYYSNSKNSEYRQKGYEASSFQNTKNQFTSRSQQDQQKMKQEEKTTQRQGGDQQRSFSNAGQKQGKNNRGNESLNRAQELDRSNKISNNKQKGQADQQKFQSQKESLEQQNFEEYQPENQQQEIRLDGYNNLEEEEEFVVKKDKVDEVRAANNDQIKVEDKEAQQGNQILTNDVIDIGKTLNTKQVPATEQLQIDQGFDKQDQNDLQLQAIDENNEAQNDEGKLNLQEEQQIQEQQKIEEEKQKEITKKKEQVISEEDLKKPLFNNKLSTQLLREAEQYYQENKDYPPEQIANFLLEYCKLFKQLGTALYIALTDVTEKAQVIRDRGNENKERAKGIFGIISLEKTQGLIELNGKNNKVIRKNNTLSNYKSLGRTILRILRFFDFLSFVVKEIDQYRNKNFSQICSEAYEQTLAPYHTFLVKNAAKAAWLTAPERQRFFEIYAPKETEEQAYGDLKEFESVLDPMRENIWDYYRANNLVALP